MSIRYAPTASLRRAASSDVGTVRSTVSWDHNITGGAGGGGLGTGHNTPPASLGFHYSTYFPNSVDYHLHEPISAGFLLKFCETHYCSENMRFITEVDRFKEHFYRDRHAWPKAIQHQQSQTQQTQSAGLPAVGLNSGSTRSVIGLPSVNSSLTANSTNLLNQQQNQLIWKQLDLELNLIAPEHNDLVDMEEEIDFLHALRTQKDFIPEDKWPSKVINRESIRESLIHIWNTFLTKDSVYWICIPYSVLINTMKRIRLIHIYGPEVFGEMLLDPVKTIQRDIYPRFYQSEDYRQMKRCHISLENLPCASKLKLPKPSFVVIFQRYDVKDIERGNVTFTLHDLLDDRILYMEFLKFLESIVAVENLYCIRAIAIYKEAMSLATMNSNTTINHIGIKHFAGNNVNSRPSFTNTGNHMINNNSAMNTCRSTSSVSCAVTMIGNSSTAHNSSASTSLQSAYEIAWTIYKFFIAPGSSFEVSSNHQMKNDVMRDLANPKLNTFDNIEQSALSQLRIHYNRFLPTKEFGKLNRLVITQREIWLREGKFVPGLVPGAVGIDPPTLQSSSGSGSGTESSKRVFEKHSVNRPRHVGMDHQMELNKESDKEKELARERAAQSSCFPLLVR